MKLIKIGGLLIVPALLILDISFAFAADEGLSGRQIWDKVMLFFNFAILVFLFIKFARAPLMKFLRSVRDKLDVQLKELKGKKQGVQSVRDAEAKNIQEIERIAQEIRENILEMGKREKAQIIEEGKLLAQKMIQDANAYSENRIRVVRKQLTDEMVDIAISLAEEKLVKSITAKDNDNIINEFIANLENRKGFA